MQLRSNHGKPQVQSSCQCNETYVIKRWRQICQCGSIKRIRFCQAHGSVAHQRHVQQVCVPQAQHLHLHALMRCTWQQVVIASVPPGGIVAEPASVNHTLPRGTPNRRKMNMQNVPRKVRCRAAAKQSILQFPDRLSG